MSNAHTARKIWDAHVHNWHQFGELGAFRQHLDRQGIERVNLLGPLRGGVSPSPLDVEASNDLTAHFREALPDRIEAFCYVNPAHTRHAVEEWRRCHGKGFRGLKLWVASLCHEETVFPVVAEAVAARCPVLVHTWDKATGNLPTESTPAHCAELAARFPEGDFIMAHLGGRFEWGIQAVKMLGNVTVDYAGSPNEAGAYELALKELGPRRIIFGTDGPCDFLSCLGRVLELESDVQAAILYDNMAALSEKAHRS